MRPLAFMMLLLLLGACRPDRTEEAANPVSDQPATPNELPAETSTTDTYQLPLTGSGTVGPVKVPPADWRETKVLTKGMWVVEFWIDRNDPAMNRPHRGLWFQFNPDGTFVGGQWTEQTHQGHWYLTEPSGDKKPFLFLDSNLDMLDMEFELQAINGSEDTMGWVATSRFVDYHIAAKIINLDSRPTKQQFGYAD